MPRSRRLTALSLLLSERRFSSQDELARALAHAGFAVTQATLSRDLRSLGVGKRPGADGAAHVRAARARRRDVRPRAPADRPGRFVNEVRTAQNLRGHQDAARATRTAWARAIDLLEFPGTVGSVAGDDTLLVVMATHVGAPRSSSATSTASAAARAAPARTDPDDRASSRHRPPAPHLGAHARPGSRRASRCSARAATRAASSRAWRSGTRGSRSPRWSRATRACPRAALEAVLPGLDPRALGPGLPAVVSIDGAPRARRRGAVDTLVVAACRTACGRAPGHAPRAPGARPRRCASSICRPITATAGDGYVYGLPEAFRAETRAAHAHRQPGLLPDRGRARAAAGARAGLARGAGHRQRALGRVAARAARRARDVVRRARRRRRRSTRPAPCTSTCPRWSALSARLATRRASRSASRRSSCRWRAASCSPRTRRSRARVSRPRQRARVRRALRGRAVRARAAAGRVARDAAVRGSNRCDLAVTTLHGGRTLLATAAIDNLVKGAAGQALQNLNLLLGWPETTGLPRHGSPGERRTRDAAARSARAGAWSSSAGARSKTGERARRRWRRELAAAARDGHGARARRRRRGDARGASALGLAPRFDDGLRVTDAATLEVAAAVLAGLANKRLVARAPRRRASTRSASRRSTAARSRRAAPRRGARSARSAQVDAVDTGAARDAARARAARRCWRQHRRARRRAAQPQRRRRRRRARGRRSRAAEPRAAVATRPA